MKPDYLLEKFYEEQVRLDRMPAWGDVSDEVREGYRGTHMFQLYKARFEHDEVKRSIVDLLPKN